MSSMSQKQQAEKIAEILQAYTPAALATAGLTDFSEYLARPPRNEKKISLGCHGYQDDNTTDMLTRGFFIIAQLPGIMNEDAYHEIIMPIIEQYITAEALGMVNRTFIKSNQQPVEPGVSTAFVLYELQFSEELDDYDDFED